MLGPQFQQKVRLAVLMLASALIVIAEPLYARNDNRGKSDQAASRQSASQTAPAQPAAPSPAPAVRAPAPAPAPAIRAPAAAPVIRAPEPSRPVQSAKPVQQPSIPVQNRNTAQNPIMTTPPQSNSMQNRNIVINQPQPSQNRNDTINPQPVQPQTRMNNPVTINQNIQPRTSTAPKQETFPTVNQPAVLTSERANTIGTSIAPEKRNSSYNSSINSNSIFNRETQKKNTNESITRNENISRGNTENTTSSNRASQPAANLNNRISTDISSHIGSTIGSQPESTTTVRNQENKGSGSRVTLPFDKDTGSLRTSPQTEVQRPAAGSSKRVSTELSTSIAGRIDKQTSQSANSQKQTPSSNRIKTTDENKKQSNNVTPPSNSARQPAGSSGTSSIDRANTDIGIMFGPDRTPPNEARKPAAGLNNDNRQSRENPAINDNQNREQKSSQTKTERQNSIGDSTRTNSSIGDTIGNRPNTSLSGERGRAPQNNTGSTVGNTKGRTETGNRSDIGGRTETRSGTGPASKPETGTRTDSSDRAGRQADKPQIGRETRPQNNNESRPAGETSDRTRITRTNPDTQTNIVNDSRASDLSGRRDLREHRYEPVQSPRITFQDRPYSRDYHHEFGCLDLYGRSYYRSITPGFYFTVGYNRGSWFTYGCIYPYYQRKYIFVSLDGYWPWDYTYMRYYWYGYHPYYWYGYYPVAREVSSDVNYYYTYNYYYSDEPYTSNYGGAAGTDYYSGLATQAAPQPAEATLADQYFEEAVDAFEAGNYNLAIEKFSRAMELAPDDMILPFAYSQALFAAGRYTESAEVLRTALAKTKSDKEGVFYPRGLYPNEDVLLTQIDKLADQAEKYSFDADLQLLLGYQLLGINDVDKAVTPLKNAGLDLKNQQASTVLMNLLTKIKMNDEKSVVPPEPVQEKPQRLLPEQSAPDKVEPNKTLYNEPNTTTINLQNIAFLDSGASKFQLETVNAKIGSVSQDNTGLERAAANNPTHEKAKEGILIAALFVLAGSTGLGHLLHH